MRANVLRLLLLLGIAFTVFWWWINSGWCCVKPVNACQHASSPAACSSMNGYFFFQGKALCDEMCYTSAP
jgi:hypothetical protein